MSNSDGLHTTDNHCCSHSLTSKGAISSEASGALITPYEGSRMLRALIRQGDRPVKGHPGRAELTGINNEDFFPYRKDRWIGFAYYIAAPTGYDLNNFGVFQWHSQAWNNPGGEEGPPFYLRVDGGPGNRWDKNYRWEVTNSYGGGEQRIANVVDSDMLNKWNQIVIHVNIDDRSHSANGKGILEVWVNGNKIVNEPYYQENHGGYGAQYGDFYFKIGADVSRWPSSGPNYPFERFIDAFRLGDENSSYQEVLPTPRRSPPPPLKSSHPTSIFMLLPFE